MLEYSTARAQTAVQDTTLLGREVRWAARCHVYCEYGYRSSCCLVLTDKGGGFM